MMGVYIKGMEMPKENQRGLWVVIHADGIVEYDSGDEGWKTLKQAAYPVPPHGRLIDADDVNNHIHGWVDLRGCPTIIPVSEEAPAGPYDLLYEEGGANTT